MTEGQATRTPFPQLFLLTALLLLLSLPSPLFASPQASTADRCFTCHGTFPGATGRSGPHGEMAANTNSCLLCHDVHGARNIYLTDGASITATCLACHDLSASSRGVYQFGRVAGLPNATSSHRIPGLQPDPYRVHVGGGVYQPFVGTNVVPGGDRLTGSSANLLDTLTCLNCHAVHGQPGEVVAPFISDSNRLLRLNVTSGVYEPVATTKLLRNRVVGPGGLETATETYGSAWCAACHLGRVPSRTTVGSVVHRVYGHPVDLGWESRLAQGWVPQSDWTVYDLYRSNRFFSLAPVTNTVYRREFGDLGGRFVPSNRNPGVLCQSCHHNERTVREPWAIRTLTVAGHVYETSQSFPHQSLTPALLATANTNDSCLNCHVPANLP